MFFRKVERFFLNLIILLIIFLASFQVIMKNETAYQRLKNFESSIRTVFKENPLTEVINYIDEDEEAYIIIDLLQDYSLPQVWVVKNGERAANFSKGIVKITVKNGDLLLLDCRFCQEPLWFEITDLSSDIRTWPKGQQFRISSEEIKLGIVQFYKKL